MKRDFYIVLSSNNNLKNFPKNKSNSFFTLLPHEFQLSQNFRLALVDLILPPCDSKSQTHVVYISCSLCEPTVTSNSYSNLLRCVAANKSKIVLNERFDNLIYIPLSKYNFQSIEIQFTDAQGQLVNFLPSNSVLTLHFKEF